MAKRNAVVVTHTRLRQTGTVVAEAVSQLRVAGFEVTIIDNTEAPDFGVQPPCVSDDTEIVVVLGGDGTILRAAELVHCTQVPILGVNMGHVGFLAEFESFQIDEAIRRVSTHDYSIDERMIAHVDVWLPGATKPIEDWALNDITLERADRGKMVELSIRVDDVEMNSFGADGVIVSTPTGSTAYAFSAGGPVMWPNVKALQLIPLAAHALFARPLIIGSGSTFTIDILDESMSEGWICCDGRRQRAVAVKAGLEIRQDLVRKLSRVGGRAHHHQIRVGKHIVPLPFRRLGEWQPLPWDAQLLRQRLRKGGNGFFRISCGAEIQGAYTFDLHSLLLLPKQAPLRVPV